MQAGDTFYRQGSRHLWVVVSDPQVNPDAVLLVNFTSNKDWQDQACVLQPGDHPFIREETVLFFAKARTESNRDLDAKLSAGQITLDDPLSDTVLTKIREGARESERLSFKFKELLEDQGLI